MKPNVCPTPALRSSVLVEQVWKSYENETIPVLRGIDLEAGAGQVIALCGPSGCGKSTLLHLIGGLDRPDRGRIVVNGAEVNRHRDMVQYLRHEVGFVFQLHNLIPDLTLEENCLLPAQAAGADHRTARDRVRELAQLTGLTHRLDQRIQKLSGGERQRTAICRALMNRPRVLLADEPTGALDERNSGLVFELLLDIARRENVTLLMATHDIGIARACDRMVKMHDGRIHESA